MREIKFRAWDEVKKEMRFDPFLKTGDGNGDWIVFFNDRKHADSTEGPLTFDNPYCRQQIHLMQYTGLKDKNGKESCGHDIAKITFTEFYSSSQFCAEEGNSITGVIKEINYAWAVELPDKSYIYFSEIVNDDMVIEVIGNIYENPELLDA